MVTKRQLENLKNKIKPKKNQTVPGIYIKNQKTGQIETLENRRPVSKKELKEKREKSSYPAVVFVRGDYEKQNK